MSFVWCREVLALALADASFRILIWYPPQRLARLSPQQRHVIAAYLRASLYPCLRKWLQCLILSRSILHRVPSVSMLRAVSLGVTANLCASLWHLPMKQLPELFLLALRSPLQLNHIFKSSDGLYRLFLLPLADELFYRHISITLSSRSSILVGSLATAFLFSCSHLDDLTFRLRFFRSCVYSIVCHASGNSYIASFLCHIFNNLSALLLDDHIASLLPPPLPPLPRCMACHTTLPAGAERYNCVSCPGASSDLCAKCFEQFRSHKRGHVHELTPIFDASIRLRVAASTCTAVVLAQAFALFATRPCVGECYVDKDGKIKIAWRSFAEIFRQVQAIAAALQRAAPRGARVLLCGGNSAAWVMSYLAVIHSGLIVCAASPHQLANVSRRVRPVVIICDGVLVPSALSCAVDSLRMILYLSPPPSLLSTTSSLSLHSLASFLQNDSLQPVAPIERNLNDIAAIVMTSGSSGIPKGVLWSDQILRNAATESLPLAPLVAVDYTPPHHAFALRQTLRVICNGGQLAVVPSVLSMRLFECFAAARPTFVGGPPAFWIELQKDFESRMHGVNDPKRLKSEQAIAFANTRMMLGNRLQVAVCGGSSSPPSLVPFLRQCLAPAIVSDGYAATECGTVALNGVIARGTEVWLDCNNDNNMGEICVASSSVCSGYLDDERASSTSFITRNGRSYYRTGDLGEQRVDGTIAIVGRVAASCKLPQGEFLNPERVESVLETSPYIQAAFVSWHAPAQKLVACIIAANKAREEQWEDTSKFMDQVRRVAQANELQAYEVPQVLLVEREPVVHLAVQQQLGRKKSRAEYAAHFQPKIFRHFTVSDLVATPPIAACHNPFVRVPALAGVLLDVLHATQLSPTQSFAAHGGDSLAAARLSRRCQAELGATLSVASALQLSSLYEIEAALHADQTKSCCSDGVGSSSTTIDWQAELELPSDFYPSAHQLAAAIAPFVPADALPSHVLLIGATGFLGPHLLASLLRLHPHAVKVYCIVRADSHATAGARLRAAASDLRIRLTDAEWSRVRPLAGFVSRPRFGLALEEYAQLVVSICAVYHNAAQVHGMLPYAALWSVNVGGALEAAKFALLCGGKHLHLISSINVLNPAADRAEAPLSADEVMTTLPLVSGYAQTKIIAESLCLRVLNDAQSLRLCSLSIHRPATISGSIRTGASNVHCFSTGVLCGLAQLGCYPAQGSIFPPFFLLTPVDFVAAAISTIGHAQSSASSDVKVWHYVTSSPTSVETLLTELQLCGHECRAVEPIEWRNKLESMSESNPLYVFKEQLLSGSLGKAHHGLGPQSIKTRQHLRTLDASLVCPPLTTATWSRYCAFLTERGLLPPASSPASPLPMLPDTELQFFQLQEWYFRVVNVTPPSVWLTLSAANLALIIRLRRTLAVPPRRPRNEPFTATLCISASGLDRQSGAPSSSFSLTDGAKEDREQFIQRLKALHEEWEIHDKENAANLTKLLTALQLLMKRVSDPLLGCFVRLGSRSPKDSTLAVTSSVATQPLSTDPLVRKYWSLSISTPHEALALLLSSSRVQHDIHTAELENMPVTVVARKFVAQDPYWEFRLFVSQGRLTAASSYHSRAFCEVVWRKQAEIATYICNTVFPTIAPLVPRAAYTADVFVAPTLTTFLLIELNPPPPIADTALFSIRSPSDALRLMQGPFELRVVQQ